MVRFASHSFSAISAQFPTTQSIFPIARDLKLTAEALGFRCSAPKKICARLFQCYLAQIYGLSQILYKMAEGWALRLARFRPFLSDFPQLKAYFLLPGTLK